MIIRINLIFVQSNTEPSLPTLGRHHPQILQNIHRQDLFS